MQEIMLKVYVNQISLLVSEYLCNRANTQANRVFVSALLVSSFPMIIAMFSVLNICDFLCQLLLESRHGHLDVVGCLCINSE